MSINRRGFIQRLAIAACAPMVKRLPDFLVVPVSRLLPFSWIQVTRTTICSCAAYEETLRHVMNGDVNEYVAKFNRRG